MRPDLRTPEAQEYRKWYKLKAWLQRRAAQLQSKPLCEWCEARGKIKPATVAHHAEPHKGDRTKFFTGKLVSLCSDCHDSDAQSEEKLGYHKGCDAEGRPLASDHPWNALSEQDIRQFRSKMSELQSIADASFERTEARLSALKEQFRKPA